MAFSRRDALRIGFALAATPVLAACNAGTLVETQAPRRPGVGRTELPTPTASPLKRATFAGAPPPGHVYFGASVPYYRSLPGWEQELGARLALNRSYFGPEESEKLLARCRADLRQGRLPHVSIKPLGTWADVASGRSDRWLMHMIDGLAATRSPVLLTLHHEPENDSGSLGMSAADFVAMQRRVIRKARESAPNVTAAPVLQQWTFDPRRSDIDPAAWVVEEADVFGLDVYNPWAPANGKFWRTFSSKFAEAERWIEGKPVVIGEYGCRIDPANPGRAREWLIDAVSYARERGVVSMAYFNSRLNSPDGSFELSGELEQSFAEMLQAPWVARPRRG